MSFQTRLLLTYSLLIILLVVLISVSFYQYSSRAFEENAYDNLGVISGKMSQQLDNLVRPMDFITTYLVSSSGFVSSMATLARLDKDDSRNLEYINDARANITSSLLTYPIDKNFYRVSFFNKIGDYLSSSFTERFTITDAKERAESLFWTADADKAKGRAVIIPPYNDPWAQSSGIKVFGLARSVQGPKGSVGYIEVQNPYSELEKIFTVPDSETTKVIAFTKSGDIFYSSGIRGDQLWNYYTQLAFGNNDMKNKSSVTDSVSVLKNPLTFKDEIIAASNSDYTGVRIILAQDRDALLAPISLTGRITILIGVLILLLSLGYIYIFSRQLAKPIRMLKQKMEETELENLPRQIKLENSNNEITSLNTSFQHLRERLNDAVSREIKSNALQMQASFDSLQAQINPHFIYNILNVLSNKGLVNSDDEICEICDSIAAMLRYSTSTLKRSATIAEELEHVGNYLLLMKKRYEHRLEFKIHADEAILMEPIPKIVLQQLVENCIHHGFDNMQKTINIDISGYLSDGRWFVEIQDNGQGFDEHILNELEARMQSVKQELSGSQPHKGFSIGGMGLINTYARLVLFYGEKLVFKIENMDGGGARVIIGGTAGIPEERVETYESSAG
jgi:two-component system sensor histidine kinase YesM